MGTYYTSSTIIGFKVTPTNIYDTKVVQNCTHNPPADVKFCPTCGKKVGSRVERTRTDAWEEFKDTANEVGFPKHYVFEEAYESDKGTFWFGYGAQVSRDDDEKKVPLKPYDEIKAGIAAIMKPWTDIGLFVLNDADFGIWALVIGR